MYFMILQLHNNNSMSTMSRKDKDFTTREINEGKKVLKIPIVYHIFIE